MDATALDWAARKEQRRLTADAINAFAADLYHQLAVQDGNLFVSPCSVHTMLTMALLGAAGATAREMGQALHLTADVQSSFGARVSEIFESEASTPGLVIANAVWAQMGVQLQPRFAADSRALVHEVDFAGASEQARQQINAWVADQTADKIRDLIGPGGVSSLTRVILTNAIYFKADSAKFDPDVTRDLPFHLADESSVGVPTMCQTEDFRAIAAERFQAINLLYEGLRVSMQVFVPRNAADLPWLERTVLARSPEEWQRDMEWRRVDLTLPRFRFDTSLMLGHVLTGMGMAKAFDSSAADFSAMTSGKFWLSDVIHSTYVDVNEEGTEAAGATAAILSTGCGADNEPLIMKIDRPFLFTICGHDFDSSILLFVGRVLDPRP